MDIVLLAVTAVALLVAFVMGAAAWRLSREARARGAARVAALAAAADEPEVARRAAPLPPSKQAFRPEAADFMRPSEDESRIPAATFAHERHGLSDGFLGTGVATEASSGQRGLAIAACLLFAVLLAGGYWTVFGDRWSKPVVSAGATAVSPLELISLRHERRGGRLAVTGLVRNPVAGAPVDKLAAVVFLFDQQGGFISSGRVDVDFTKLAPGDESPFVITVDAPANIARYRVSFRNDAGVVAHIDRRGQEPIANADAAPVRQ